MPSIALPTRARRLLGALPDAITAAACLTVWIAPLAFGQGAVKTVVLMMLMEFLLVHGAGFFTVVAFMDASRGKRLLAMAGLLLFYALFVGVFAWSFSAWWPVWVFLWLAVGKAAWIFIASRDREQERNRQMAAWGFSVAIYLAVVFATLLVPLPRLGIHAELVPTLGLPGSGEWIENPHIAVAAMTLYYLAQAAFKYWFAGRGADVLAALGKRGVRARPEEPG